MKKTTISQEYHKSISCRKALDLRTAPKHDANLYQLKPQMLKELQSITQVCTDEGMKICRSVKVRKPKASRERSAEIYLLGTGFLGAESGPVEADGDDMNLGETEGVQEGGNEVRRGDKTKRKKLDDLMAGMLE